MPARHWLGVLAWLLAAPAAAQELVVNGDFEDGLADWTIWAAVPGSPWNGTWLHLNDCDIWVPTNGCPFAGVLSHSQKKGSGAGNAHGGIAQPIAVQAGRQYRVQGQWSGGVTGNTPDNATWWEVVVYDGAVDDATIDAGLRPQDVLIDKIERTALGTNEVFQFQWQPFSGVFTAESALVTLAFKHGSFSTFASASYHDAVSIQLLPQPELDVTKTDTLLQDLDSDGNADRGDRLGYTIVMTNPVDANQLEITNLQLLDVPGAGLQLVVGSVSTSAGTITSGNTAGDTEVAIELGTLADGASVTVSFEATIDPALSSAATQVSNQASASADNIAATLSDDPDTVAAGDATITPVQGIQVITGFLASPLPAQIGGSAALSATGGASGNPVIFASLAPQVCLVTGTTVNFVAAGQCVLSANQAGNATFAAAAQVLLSIGVGGSVQAIPVAGGTALAWLGLLLAAIGMLALRPERR